MKQDMTNNKRWLEKHPFSAKDVDALRSFLIPAILWLAIIGLVATSVFYVSDNVRKAEIDRIAAAAWVCAIALGLIIIWGQAIRLLLADKSTSLREKIKTNRVELIFLSLMLGMAFLLCMLSMSQHQFAHSS